MCHPDNEKWEKRNNERNWTNLVRDSGSFMVRLYMVRKEARRGLASIGDYVDASFQGFKKYILITAADNCNCNT